MNEEEVVKEFARWIAAYFDGDAGMGEEGFLELADRFLVRKQ